MRICVHVGELWTLLPLSHFVLNLLTLSSLETKSRITSAEMPCPVIETSEMAQVVTDHLVHVSPKSVASLGHIYKALEEQALCALASDRESLQRLVQRTLPPDILSDAHCRSNRYAT